jgi:hypothetical protein
MREQHSGLRGQRTAPSRRWFGCKFVHNGFPITFSAASDKLSSELRLLGARNAVLSYNPHNRHDPGAAVYFTLGKRQMAMACDRYDNQAANLRSRSGSRSKRSVNFQRHDGGAMLDPAFVGFAVLPSPDAPTRSWRDLLGLTDGMRIDKETIERLYRIRAKEVHPDNRGTHEAMTVLNVAREHVLREISGN